MQPSLSPEYALAPFMKVLLVGTVGKGFLDRAFSMNPFESTKYSKKSSPVCTIRRSFSVRVSLAPAIPRLKEARRSTMVQF